MKEIFKDIKGYEGLYQISNFGNVKSLQRDKEKLLRQYIKRGYFQVGLSKEGTVAWKSVHRLVAEAFIDNPDNLPQVNHKDEDKTNNRVDNLEWCTADYNNKYGTRTKRATKSNSKPIIQLNLNGEIIKEWRSAAEVEKELGFNDEFISDCAKQKYGRKTAYGYKWRYKEVS